MRGRKRVVRLIKKNLPGQAAELTAEGRTNLTGYLKLLIEMDKEANYESVRQGGRNEQGD